MNFGLLWAKVAPNGEFLGPSVECKVLEKTVSHPYGVRSEAILFGPFGYHMGLSLWQNSIYHVMLPQFGAFWTLFGLCGW